MTAVGEGSICRMIGALKDRSRRVYVDFDGAMANAEVWVNGQKAGGHPYGYSSFRIDITPYVKFGRENVMAASWRS